MRKNKLYWVVSLIIGLLLLLASVIIPFYKMVNSNIIGGADLPTFRLYFQQTAWLTLDGVGISAVSLIVLWLRKK